MARKARAAMAAEVKEEVKAVEAAPVEEATEAPAETAPVKETGKKAAEKKTSSRKTASKKTETASKKASAKVAVQTNLFIQYQGAELSYSDLIERAKSDAGVKSPKSVNLYVKPEDNMVYYVVDEKVGGFVLA